MSAAALPAAPPAELEELLAPIAPEAPAGESLRYDPIQDRIRELRREDDPTLPQGVWKHELKKADWHGVVRETSEALRTRTKDLQMAAWLTEAWVHLDGLAGLIRGLDLVAALCERYWETVHPRPDELDEETGSEEPGTEGDAATDLTFRVAPLGWLSRAVPEALLRLPLSRPRGEESEVCTWGDWKHALYVENLGATRPEAAAELGGVSREGSLASVGLTESGFYGRLAAEADGSIAALARLATVLDERCGDAAPSFGAAREALESIGRLARRIASERGETVAEAGAAGDPPAPEPAAAEEEAASEEPGEAGASGTASDGGPGASPTLPCTITSRAEAYRALGQAAEFLLQVEPHSPVPYLVKRAVRWGGLSLSELFDELFDIADPKSVYRLLGIRGAEEE